MYSMYNIKTNVHTLFLILVWSFDLNLLPFLTNNTSWYTFIHILVCFYFLRNTLNTLFTSHWCCLIHVIIKLATLKLNCFQLLKWEQVYRYIPLCTVSIAQYVSVAWLNVNRTRITVKKNKITFYEENNLYWFYSTNIFCYNNQRLKN